MVFAILAAGAVASDRAITHILSPYAFLSDERGFMAGFDHRVSSGVADARKRITLQEELTRAKGPEERLAATRTLLSHLAAMAKSAPQDTAIQQESSDLLMGAADEFAQLLSAHDIIFRAADIDRAASRADAALQRLVRLRQVALEQKSLFVMGKLIPYAQKAGLTAFDAETCKLASEQFPHDVSMQGAYLRVLRAAPDSPAKKQELARVDALIKAITRDQAFQRTVLQSLRSLYEKQGLEAAEAFFKAQMELSMEDTQRLRVQSEWADLLLWGDRPDMAASFLPAVVDAQAALIADKRQIIPSYHVAWLLTNAVYGYRERGDVDGIAKASAIADVFAPNYAPWFKGELWYARGATDTPPLPVVRIPWADAAGFVPDGKADEGAWSRAVRLPYPYYYYANYRSPNVELLQTGGPEIRLFHNGTALYMHIRVPEPNMHGLVATHNTLDLNMWHDDSAELYFSGGRFLERYIQLMANCKGAATFLVCDSGAMSDGTIDVRMPKVIRTPQEPEAVAATQEADAWTLEFMLPFSSLGVVMPADGKPGVGTMALRTHRAAGGGDTPAFTSWNQIIALGTHYQQTRGFAFFEPAP